MNRADPTVASNEAISEIDDRDAPYSRASPPSRKPDVGGRVVSKVVTHRVVLGAWEMALAEGISPTEFSEETRAMVNRVRNSRERVDWYDYMELIDRIREIAGSTSEMTRMFSTHLGAMPDFARVAKLLLNPRQLYRFLVFTFATAGFSHIHSTLEDVGRDRVKVRVSLPPQYRDGTAFFESCTGGLRALPCYIDLPPAEVEANITSHEATFDVHMPSSRTLVSRIAPAVRAALDELAFYADEIRELTSAASSSDGPAAVERAARRFSLTRRQREVACLLMRGASNKEIASELGCAERTVELHVTALMRKTGTANRTQLAATLLS
jgi:DNA-binding CsgD family transcriptional regulator